MKNKKPRILFYDIETSPLKAWVWGCGEQVIRHGQLDRDFNTWGIICIAYCWNDGKPAKVIGWDYEKQNTKSVIEQFDEIIQQADHTIGKNSDRFDTKMINASRMLNGLPGLPQWTKYTDDLEKQMRKHFRLPSQSLDYISSILGLGGKVKMEMQDWIDIMEKNDNGLKSYNKMLKYCKKDVEDTRGLWYHLSEHFEPRFNMATYLDDRFVCRHEDCGSTNLKLNGVRMSGRQTYQQFQCRDCGRYAGRALLTEVHKVLSKRGIE